jgi:hypothetical protein
MIFNRMQMIFIRWLKASLCNESFGDSTAKNVDSKTCSQVIQIYEQNDIFLVNLHECIILSTSLSLLKNVLFFFLNTQGLFAV